jgi:hypothetical protein
MGAYGHGVENGTKCELILAVALLFETLTNAVELRLDWPA